MGSNDLRTHWNDLIDGSAIPGHPHTGCFCKQVQFAGLILSNAKELSQCRLILQKLDLYFLDLPWAEAYGWRAGCEQAPLPLPPITENVAPYKFRERFAAIVFPSYNGR